MLFSSPEYIVPQILKSNLKLYLLYKIKTCPKQVFSRRQVYNNYFSMKTFYSKYRN